MENVTVQFEQNDDSEEELTFNVKEMFLISKAAEKLGAFELVKIIMLFHEKGKKEKFSKEYNDNLIRTLNSIARS